jgi:trichothecene 3-O-acetyltransferase
MHIPAPITTQDSLDFYLDVFGQQPGLQTCTQICLCFSISEASSHSAIINTLTNGLERLSASFPWVAGQVVNEGASKGNSGVYKIKSLDRTPRLVVRDFRNDLSIPTMDEMRRANFPMSMLDETIIAPRNTIPETFGEPPHTTPVFLIQANFITGGLLLTFVGSHQTMDMTGQAQIIRLLARACRNEEFTSEELLWGNYPRRDIIPLLDDFYEPSSEITEPTPSQPISDSTNGSPAPPLPPKCIWAIFSFDPTSLVALKSLATEAISSGYISTDDALSAFIWQSIVRARLPRLNPKSKSTFARAVDPRRYLDIPQTYTGVVQNMTFNTYTIQRLINEPLGFLASQFRLALDPKTCTLGHSTRALATTISRTTAKSTTFVPATLDLSSSDIMLSSWAKENLYELDFNLGLGKPESVRRPQFFPVESMILILPKRLDGELAVAICLRDEDMERLRMDEEFAKYGKYIG